MTKNKIIISILVTITLITGLSVFLINKNKKMYITNIEEIEDIKISMMKVENGVFTIIKQVPTTGNWEMEYNCDNEEVNIYWDEENKKLLIKNIKETGCVVKFMEPTSSIDVVALYVDDIYTPELNNDLYYTLLSYNCSNEETVKWNSSTNSLTITPLKKNTRCNLYFEEGLSDFDKVKLVNKPVLVEGMTPVKWTGSPGSYTEVNTTEDDSEWYDYSQKKWANVKTADGSYWVWIPRYAYKITSGIHTGGSGVSGTIDVKFLMGGTNKTTDGTTIETSGYEYGVKDTSMHYFTHPAFTFGSDEVSGIWVAKYEASTTGTCNTTPSDANCNKTDLIPAFKPNVTGWRWIYVGNMYEVAYNLRSKSNYGWQSSTVDTHQMKNTEWGAVAYLAQSVYGANQEIWINNSSTYTTGCAGNSVSESQYSGCQNAYNTAIGVKASTTHNITGIYDISGGAHEYTATYVNNGDGNLTTNGSQIVSALAKYKDIYTAGSGNTKYENYEANKNKYGDAVYETSGLYEGYNSWYTDTSDMPYSSSPWFYRGGNYSVTTDAGAFYFNDYTGASSISIGFRAVAVIP